MKWLREVIAVRKWEVNQAAGRYIRSHEEVQRLSIQHRLNDFMHVHGTELMNLNGQSALIKNRALDRSTAYLRDALAAWLEDGAEINYAAQDNDILTAIGFRPDVASRVDYQEKYTPAQNLIYARRKAGLADREPV